MTNLFNHLTVRETTIRNRIGLSPMSMYDADDGVAGSFSAIHFGARSLGGAGLVFTGTVAVAPEGRITPGDPGLWADDQIPALKAVADAIRVGGGTSGIQIGHAGRKASTTIPWRGGHPKSDGRSLTASEGAWETVGPSAIAYGSDKTHTPRAMTEREIRAAIDAFAATARRADLAGFDVLEIHGAHGYLLHSFASPISNARDDAWGGSFENRIRLTLDVVRTVRAAWPATKPLALRFAMEDFHEGGWTAAEGLELARRAAALGVDILDPMSFGGVAAGGQAPWAEPFTRDHATTLKSALPAAVIAGSAQTAPGFNTDPAMVEALVAKGPFDLVLLGRQLLADPHWPAKAAATLSDDRLLLPSQYEHWLTGRIAPHQSQAA
ncbi:MAG: hypothetical protein AAGM38_14505 [Pseudomonadota bacterium]